MKKIILSGLALILGCTTIASTPFVFAQPKVVKAADVKFSDLSPADSGYNQVQSLVKQGAIKGFPGGKFKPHQNISREHVAVILANALKLPVPKNVSKTLSVYDDVKSTHPYSKQIAAVTAADIFKGNNKKFRPSQTINREQMATVIVKAFNLTGNSSSIDLIDFAKLDASHRDNVKILAQNNITIGKINQKGQRYYDGTRSLTRVQFSIFLDKALNSFEVVDIS